MNSWFPIFSKINQLIKYFINNLLVNNKIFDFIRKLHIMHDAVWFKSVKK